MYSLHHHYSYRVRVYFLFHTLININYHFRKTNTVYINLRMGTELMTYDKAQ